MQRRIFDYTSLQNLEPVVYNLLSSAHLGFSIGLRRLWTEGNFRFVIVEQERLFFLSTNGHVDSVQWKLWRPGEPKVRLVAAVPLIIGGFFLIFTFLIIQLALHTVKTQTGH